MVYAGVVGQPRGMTTEEKITTLHSPESDCNSNNLDSTGSYLSNTSSQDVDFIQDNSDYQWFLDYGYRETQHRSILSLSASYEEGCYDDLARDLDSQLAQVDMEDFRAEDILTNLPAMCCQDLQQPGRRGEMFASVSGSMMVKFDFDSSLSPQSSSQEEEEVEEVQCESMCKSGPLFSPVRESPLCHYSVDSLDCEEQDMLLTCQANKDNYTIAFEGSTVMGDDSDCHETGESHTSGSGSGSNTWSSEDTRREAAGMTSSDARTTWCKVVTRRNHHNSCMRHSTASLPSLRHQLHQSTHRPSRPGACVKLYDVNSSSASGSESSLSDRQHSRLNLVRLFIKQRGCTMAHSDYTTAQRTNTQTRSAELCDNRPNKNLVTSDRNQNQVTNWVAEQSFADSLIDEAAESESVERLSESVSVCSCDASLNMSRQLSGNNNNSLEREDIKSPVSQMRRGTQTHSGSATSSVSDPTEVSRAPAHLRNSATQCPLHCVDASMQTSASVTKPITNNPSQVKQPVYVMYPNYTLPDLGFLRDDRLDLEQVFLTPWRFSPGWTPLASPTQGPPTTDQPSGKRTRPHSCADIDHLRKKGFSHIKDWESLALLLPPEYCALLSDIPELRDYKDLCTPVKPLFCVSPPAAKTNATQFSPFPDGRCTTNNSSTSSTGTQPSSGYRGSSTLLSDSSAHHSPALTTTQNPMFVYRYDSATSDSGCSGPPLPKRSISLPEDKNIPPPPRPPLPKGILRNSLENAKLHKNQANKKRHSMFDMDTANVDDPELVEVDRKMRLKAASGQLSGSDEGYGPEMWRPPTPPTTHALRLQQLLEMSGDQWDPRDMDLLKQQVSRFLSQGRKSVSFADKGEESAMTPPNSPQVSVNHKPTYQLKGGPALNETTISEDSESSFSQDRLQHSAKTELVEVVADAAMKLTAHAGGCSELVSSVALSALCPALYSLLSDGLKPSLDTAFGDINNSVWQVVEASAQQGPMTKALNELVLKLNSEDVLTEGVVKFNAFIFGLLNVQGLDVWLSYLRTRESVLRRHYALDSLMLSACRGQTSARALSDKLLAALRPLAQFTFKLDLLYETRLLHQSLLQLSRLPSSPSHSGSSGSSRGSWTLRRLMESPPPEGRPRSCVDSVSSSADLAATARKRWSVNLGGKLTQAYDRLADDTEEEYTDSLETGAGVAVKGSSGGEENSDGSGKFRRLQMKWEMLSGKENSSQESSPHVSPAKSSSPAVPKSRIPRPVTSPVRPGSCSIVPQSIRPPIKKPLTTASQLRRPTTIPPRPRPVEGPVKARTSRVDAPAKTGPVARPSSLPYRPQKAPESHRRAASSSTVRLPSRQQSTPPHKFVVTLSHRLPSDSGHLAYNEGERLRLVLEVDDTWLLCCRGDAKGLVPRAGVLPVSARI